MQKISTIVITRNEECNIGRCLQSVSDVSDEIVVVDSHSDDRTVELARAHTDRVFVRDWEGYAKQKEFAVAQCRNEWILWVDADEEVSRELAKEIKGLDFAADGYHVPRKVWYLGRWIMHCGWYPGYVLRLFRKSKGVFNDKPVHESVDLSGATRRLSGPLFHYPYRDIAHHLAKMNEFTSLAAQQMRRAGRTASLVSIAVHTAGKFANMYAAKRGFLDGAPGLVVSILGAYYVFLKYAKLYEMQR
jgi:glycosyltransferase involved in cell wall biosynthesis